MPNEKISNKKHVAHLQVVKRQERAIMISAIVISVAVILIVAYGILGDTVFRPYRTVATVNGDKISAGEFEKLVKLQRLQMISQFNQYYQFAQMFGVADPLNDQSFGSILQQIMQQLSVPTAVGQQVVDQLVNDRLIRQEAERRGITVSAEEIDQALQEQQGYFANGTPTPAATATAFATPTLNPAVLEWVTITPTATEAVPTATATLDPNVTPTATATLAPTATTGPTFTPEPSATPYTLEGFNTAFDEQFKVIDEQTGMSREDYRRYFESLLLRDKLQKELTKDLPASEEQVWARHILVADEALAKVIAEKAKAGDDFAKLAAEFSTDTTSKERGGDLGWFGKGQMVAPFEEAAFALQPGQISDPVQTDYGWHIIQVLDKGPQPLSEDEFTQYKDTFFTNFLNELREQSEVVINEAFWQEIVPSEPALQ